MNIIEEIEKVTKEVEGMKSYLQLKFDLEDWHGVADAAMDIRELESRKKTLEDVKEGFR